MSATEGILRRVTCLAIAGAFSLASAEIAAAGPPAGAHHHFRHRVHSAANQGAPAAAGTPGGLIGNALAPHPGPYYGGTFGNGPYGGYMGW
jgi:hypothetical protein